MEFLAIALLLLVIPPCSVAQLPMLITVVKKHDWYYLMAKDEMDFLHVTAKILDGRSVDQKQVLAKKVIERMSDLSFESISLTVEVMDIDRSSYQKHVVS